MDWFLARHGFALPSIRALVDVMIHEYSGRLLLDSRVVDVPMASNPTFVTLSSLKPFFFNGLQNE
jgi:hypothetical protein